jgi:Xaa-Pro aminopeptidase
MNQSQDTNELETMLQEIENRFEEIQNERKRRYERYSERLQAEAKEMKEFASRKRIEIEEQMKITSIESEFEFPDVASAAEPDGLNKSKSAVSIQDVDINEFIARIRMMKSARLMARDKRRQVQIQGLKEVYLQSRSLYQL